MFSPGAANCTPPGAMIPTPRDMPSARPLGGRGEEEKPRLAQVWAGWNVERAAGIEPAYEAWKATA